MNSKLTTIALAMLLLIVTTRPTLAITYQTLDDPLATKGTIASGISGGNIVGSYYDASGAHGFHYNGANYKPLNEPLAGPAGTYAYGTSDSNVVGSYTDTSNVTYGFIYNGGIYTPFADPSAGPFGTNAYGIAGSKVVGSYLDTSGAVHGFFLQRCNLHDAQRSVGNKWNHRIWNFKRQHRRDIFRLFR